MYIVPNLETRTWRKKVGPEIGGPKPFVPPDVYETELVQTEPERRFIIMGPAYTDALFSTYCPIMPNTGKLSLQLEYKIDQNTLDDCQALEMDSRMQINKIGRNWSSQFNFQKGGVWQGYIKGRGWVDTTFKPGKFTKDVWHRIRFDYSFNLTTGTYSYEAVHYDDLPVFNCPPELKNLPATPLLWEDGVNLQIQLDINYKPGAYETRMRRGSYIWS